MTINYWLLGIFIVIEYFIWAVWLGKDGFFEEPNFAPHGIIEAIQYTYYKFYYSFNEEAKAMGLLASLAAQGKANREALDG